MSWQPIETAPKDGTVILLTDGRSVEVGGYEDGDQDWPWTFVDNISQNAEGLIAPNAWKAGAVTHWMPLPEAPALRARHQSAAGEG